jgi:hypothetical protein
MISISQVSKSILMAHSDVFDRMLQANMDESKSGIINFENTSIDTVKAFVKFVHLGEVTDLDKPDRELFVLADKYDVRQLAVSTRFLGFIEFLFLCTPLTTNKFKGLCAEIIAKSLTKDNAFDYLELVFMHANQALKNYLLDFVTIHNGPGNFRQILKSVKWSNLQTEIAKVAEEIMDAVFDHTHYLG